MHSFKSWGYEGCVQIFPSSRSYPYLATARQSRRLSSSLASRLRSTGAGFVMSQPDESVTDGLRCNSSAAGWVLIFAPGSPKTTGIREHSGNVGQAILENLSINLAVWHLPICTGDGAFGTGHNYG